MHCFQPGITYSPLFYAVDEGNTYAVQCLLKRGADVHWCNTSGINVLSMMARRGAVDLADMITKGIEDPEKLKKYVNVANQDGWGCLHSAAENGHIDMAKWLIDRDGIIV